MKTKSGSCKSRLAVGAAWAVAGRFRGGFGAGASKGGRGPTAGGRGTAGAGEVRGEGRHGARGGGRHGWGDGPARHTHHRGQPRSAWTLKSQPKSKNVKKKVVVVRPL